MFECNDKNTPTQKTPTTINKTSPKTAIADTTITTTTNGVTTTTTILNETKGTAMATTANPTNNHTIDIEGAKNTGNSVQLPAEVLQTLYHEYSIKQRQSGLKWFVFATILFNDWTLVVPQGQSIELLRKCTTPNYIHIYTHTPIHIYSFILYNMQVFELPFEKINNGISETFSTQMLPTNNI